MFSNCYFVKKMAQWLIITQQPLMLEKINTGNTNWGGRLSTVDLLVWQACFCKKKINKDFNIKRADLNWLVQGGQPYGAFPFSKTSLVNRTKLYLQGLSEYWQEAPRGDVTSGDVPSVLVEAFVYHEPIITQVKVERRFSIPGEGRYTIKCCRDHGPKPWVPFV
jgi:hypothetical protein